MKGTTFWFTFLPSIIFVQKSQYMENGEHFKLAYEENTQRCSLFSVVLSHKDFLFLVQKI